MFCCPVPCVFISSINEVELSALFGCRSIKWNSVNDMALDIHLQEFVSFVKGKRCWVHGRCVSIMIHDVIL